MFNIKNQFLALLIIIFSCLSNGYAQVILGGDGNANQIEIDYSAPKSYEVGGITASGTTNFDARLLYFQVGDIIDIPGDEISRSIKRIWSSGLYEDVSIVITKVVDNKVFLEVKLADRSRLVAFGFRGANKSEESDLREKIKLSQGNIVNENMKQTCINNIKEFYIDKGFYNCTVEVEEKADATINRGVNLFFNINKGKKVKIEKIYINGNQYVVSGRLTKAMKETREKTRYMPFYKADTVIRHFIKNPEEYKSKDLLEHLGDYFSDRVKIRLFKASKFNNDHYEADKIKLIEKYNEYGFRDAYIIKDSVDFSGDKINIYIDVNEGPRYYFRNITFAGNTKYTSTFLRQLLNIEKGDVYNQSLLMKNLEMNENGTDLSSLYMNDGHLFFYANPVEILVENDSIDIEIRIREGKQAKYNKITISGNTKTSDNVILREVTTIPGQLFNRADIVRTQQVLLSLGYFNQETLNVITKPNEADGTVDIEYIVEETSSDQLELSVGYGATQLVLSAGISFNNFSFNKFFKKDAWTPVPSGDGQRLAFKAATNGSWYQYYIFSFSEPWLGGKKPNAFSASLSYQIQTSGAKKTDPAFWSLRVLSASTSLTRKVKWPDDYFYISHTLLYQRYQVENCGGQYVFSDGFSNNLSYIFSISRNSVSAPIYPREGSEIMFSMQLTPPYSLFSNKNYSTLTDQEKYKWLEMHKWKLNISWFTKIVQNLVLNVRFKMGFMGYYNKAIGASPFERFYLGGDGLSNYSLDGREVIGMRGYDDSDCNPREPESSLAAGATIYNKFTAELRYPISLNPNATIYLLAFAEAGKAWNDKREYTPFKLYKSAGVGVRIYLPMFGLLGFDWGYGFDNIPGVNRNNKGQFHISINQSID